MASRTVSDGQGTLTTIEYFCLFTAERGDTRILIVMNFPRRRPAMRRQLGRSIGLYRP